MWSKLWVKADILLLIFIYSQVGIIYFNLWVLNYFLFVICHSCTCLFVLGIRCQLQFSGVFNINFTRNYWIILMHLISIFLITLRSFLNYYISSPIDISSLNSRLRKKMIITSKTVLFFHLFWFILMMNSFNMPFQNVFPIKWLITSCAFISPIIYKVECITFRWNASCDDLCNFLLK